MTLRYQLVASSLEPASSTAERYDRTWEFDLRKTRRSSPATKIWNGDEAKTPENPYRLSSSNST